MNIVIVGAGKVGYTIAKYLSAEDDNITIIDNKDIALERINNNLDVMCVKGNCMSLKVLIDAGIKEADMIIAVTSSDELNMICTLAAKKLGVKYTAARVRTPNYDEDISILTEALGIDLVINPEKAGAMEIAKLIKYPSVSSIDDFSNGKVNLVGFKITEETNLDGKKLSEIDYIRGNVIFCGVERAEEVIIPNGDFILKNGDKGYVIGEHKAIVELFKRLGKYKKRIKSSMIIGGGKISYYLAKTITDVGVNCKIIEPNIKKCEELTELLPKSIIINGDGTDQQLLLSENLVETDSFISLTGRDEDNLIISLFAANNDINNIITKITRDNYNDIAKSIGINAVISPKIVTANKIIKYVRNVKNERKSGVENVYKICNEKAEAIELVVDENTSFINRKLKDIEFIDNILIATIVRDGKTIIPTGDDFLIADDKIIVVTKKAKIFSVNDLGVGGNE